jgi:hypothetical protein
VIVALMQALEPYPEARIAAAAALDALPPWDEEWDRRRSGQSELRRKRRRIT